ncbi:MAG: hypothetical protein J6L65_04700, partial [Lachnospiraceae bacterium]|nr:hypothetical protein [Lachnospiraceae bacterium]
SKLLKAKKYTNTAETLINASHLMSNAASFGMCADAMMATGFSMYDKYYIQGQSADSNTKWEVLSLGMSALGCVISGRGISKSTKSMSNMLQQEGFTNALKGEVMEMASIFKSKMPELNNKGFVNLDELAKIGKGGKSGSPSKTVYRGDRASVVPEDVFQNGFSPKGTHNDALLHTKSNATAGNFVSTSGDMSIATDFGGKNGYVYVIQTDNYVDINATYGAGAYFPEQIEFSIPGGIKPSEIVGAYKKQGGEIVGDFIPNPNFGGN